jgi:hypothetical protein
MLLGTERTKMKAATSLHPQGVTLAAVDETILFL